MKIEIEREKLLSNFEVYQHLKQIQTENNWDVKPTGDFKKDRKVKRAYNPNLEAISRDVISYLEKSNIQQQNEENVSACVRDLMSKYQLEKIEILQIINFKPLNLVNLYSIVDECDQRFNEDEIEGIINTVAHHFPGEEDEGEEGEEGEEGDVEME